MPRAGIRVVSCVRRSVESVGCGYEAIGVEEDRGCAGRGFEMCVYEERMWCLRSRVRADMWASVSFSDCWIPPGYRVRRTARNAGYATDKRWIESFSGVMVGRERRHGLKASWKTESRFVRRRMSDFAVSRGDKKAVRIEQPDAL